jgi:glutathione S-transferase
MSLTLYFHPLSSLLPEGADRALRDRTPFDSHLLVDLTDPVEAAAFRKLSPLGKFPVLVDSDARPAGPRVQHHHRVRRPALSWRPALIPVDPDLALRTRLADRFYDLYVHDPMQRIVGDRLRPADERDSHAVEGYRAALGKAYDLIDADMADDRSWAVGEVFTLGRLRRRATALLRNKLVPFGDRRKLTGYFDRLSRRPSGGTHLRGAAPYLKLFPG